MPVRFGENEDDDQEPIMASNSRFDNLRDTLAAFKSPLRASDSTVDTTSEFSEPESTVPELSQAEERAIRLSASQFEPIETQDHQAQRAHTPDHQAHSVQAQGSTSMRNYEDIADWQPSPGIQQLIEGETGPKYTRTWDNEGLDIEPEMNTPRVDIIPQQTRERTPDSVMATGTRQIHRPGPSGGAVGFRPPNLQQNGHTDFFKPVMREQLPDLNATTRGYVGEYNRHNESIELSRDTVRVEDVNFENVDGRGKVNKKQEGSSFLLPKMVLFVIGLMIILAGIVALIVKFKKNEYEGTGAQILPDPVHRLECPNVTISLGDDVEFTCTFETSKTHGKRKSLDEYSYSKIEARDRVISEDRLVFNETVNRGDDLQLVFTAVDEGRKARCSTEGGYFINMYDKNDTLLHQANVTIKLESSTIQTTMEQHLDDCPTSGEVNTYFETTCSISGDCKSYNPSILRTGGRGNPEPLNHLMECKRNFTDEAGYSLRCTAEIPDTYVTDSSHIRCRMNAEQRRLERTFVLPECPRTDTCLTRDYPFNCSDKGNHIPELKNASCNFQQVKNCLRPGRKIFNLHKNDDGKLFCRNVDRTVPVCRLSWCKDYRYILKDVMPGQLICGSGFIEQEYKPPVTTPSTPKPVTTPSTPKPVTTPVPSR